MMSETTAKTLTVLSFTVLFYFTVVSEKPNYQVAYQWFTINFTWTSRSAYKSAISSKHYIPDNNQLAAIKIYKNNMYVALPRFRSGTPVTLGVFSMKENRTTDIPIRPYPSWEMNAKKNCSTLQSVHGIEIDSNGILWAIDGTRLHSISSCPAKLVLMDLNKKGKVIHSFNIPDRLTPSDGGFLRDIVVDETDGGYAYITDSTQRDPGILIYSRQKNRTWKIRDASMFGEKEGASFWAGGVKVKNFTSVCGIALGPQGDEDDARTLYYSALGGFKLHSITNEVLKDETKCKYSDWRIQVKHLGNKTDRSDGLAMDNKKNIYFGLLTKNAVKVWNINEPINMSRTIVQSRKDLIWPKGFAFDNSGHMFISSGLGGEFRGMDHGISRDMEDKKKKSNRAIFRILKIHVGSDSYIYLGSGD